MCPDSLDSTSPSTELAPVRRLAVAEAQALVAAGRGLLVDTRDRRLYDNAHATGAVSLPLSAIEAAPAQAAESLASDRLLILYCA